MSRTEKLLIIYETEAKQWACYLQTAFTGEIPEDGICCYDVTTVSSRKDDSLTLSRYACKLLILSKGMLEGLHQMRQLFLSRVLNPAACVVVLLCGVDSLTPLLDQVPIKGDECLQISCEQDPPEYVPNVMNIIQKGASAVAANMNPVTHRPSGSEPRGKQMLSSGADRVKSSVVIIPSRVPCGSSSKVFVLLKNNLAASDYEVEFKAERKIERVKPICWSEQILCVNTPDFPAGNVRVTVYSDGKSLSSSKLQYYTRIEELACLLSSVADPVEFMCQALQVCSVDKLDQKLSSMLVELMPTGGFQGLQMENTPENGDLHTGDVPSLLHFAAQYGFRSLSGLLLQCPGAERALRTVDRHGQTPVEIARTNGHEELHVMLKQTLKMLGSGEDNSVYEMMCNAIVGKPQRGEGEDEDLYTPLGVNDEPNPDFKCDKALDLTNRPPAPTPRPECMQLKGVITPYIAQVFKKKKIPKKDAVVYSLTSKQEEKQEDGVPGTYDTFIPNQMQLELTMELQKKKQMGSLFDGKAPNHCSDQQQQQQLQKGEVKKLEEKPSHLRSGVLNNRDDCVYDKINNVHQTPSFLVKESRRESKMSESEFYTKPLKGQKTFWKVGKR